MKLSAKSQRIYDSLPVAQPGESARDVRARLARVRDDEQAVPRSTSPDPGEARIAGGQHVLSLKGSADTFTMNEDDDGVHLYRHDDTGAQLVASLPPGKYGFTETDGFTHVHRVPDGEVHREVSDLTRKTGDATSRSMPFSSGRLSHQDALREHNTISHELFGHHHDEPRSTRTLDIDRKPDALKVRAQGLGDPADQAAGLKALNALNARRWGGRP